MDNQHNRMSKWNWRPNEGAKINRTKQRAHTRRRMRWCRKKMKRAQPSCTLRKGKKSTLLKEPVLWICVIKTLNSCRELFSRYVFVNVCAAVLLLSDLVSFVRFCRLAADAPLVTAVVVFGYEIHRIIFGWYGSHRSVSSAYIHLLVRSLLFAFPSLFLYFYFNAHAGRLQKQTDKMV